MNDIKESDEGKKNTKYSHFFSKIWRDLLFLPLLISIELVTTALGLSMLVCIEGNNSTPVSYF